MTITQTVEITADHRLIIDVPREVPSGRTQVIIQFPVRSEETISAVPADAKGQLNNEAFRNALNCAYGAWQNNPWTNHLEDINKMRDEWDHRDSLNTNPLIMHKN
ncbi:MAG: hypothetical protein FWB95_05845 [Treponema sp.]|nr:hypothetical protein [Treponema sp.]